MEVDAAVWRLPEGEGGSVRPEEAAAAGGGVLEAFSQGWSGCRGAG